MILVLILYVFGAYWVAWWMLEPINRVGGRLQLSTQYMLTDFLVLMGLLQLPLAFVGWATDFGRGGERDNSVQWLLLFILCGLVIVLWAAAVNVVSKAGITRVVQRFIVIVVLVPGTLAVIISWPLALFAGLPGIGDDARLAVTVGLALVGVMFGIRRLSFWALVGSPGCVGSGTRQSIDRVGSHVERGNQ